MKNLGQSVREDLCETQVQEGYKDLKEIRVLFDEQDLQGKKEIENLSMKKEIKEQQETKE